MGNFDPDKAPYLKPLEALEQAISGQAVPAMQRYVTLILSDPDLVGARLSDTTSTPVKDIVSEWAAGNDALINHAALIAQRLQPGAPNNMPDFARSIAGSIELVVARLKPLLRLLEADAGLRARLSVAGVDMERGGPVHWLGVLEGSIRALRRSLD